MTIRIMKKIEDFWSEIPGFIDGLAGPLAILAYVVLGVPVFVAMVFVIPVIRFVCKCLLEAMKTLWYLVHYPVPLLLDALHSGSKWCRQRLSSVKTSSSDRFSPPESAHYLLRLLPIKYRGTLVDDVEEEFFIVMDRSGIKKARRYYWAQTIWSWFDFVSKIVGLATVWRFIRYFL